MQLLVFFLLFYIASLDLFLQLVLFVEHLIFGFHNVHLKNCSWSLFLSANDLYLPSVIFELWYNVIQYALQTFKLTPESHCFFAYQPRDSGLGRLTTEHISLACRCLSQHKLLLAVGLHSLHQCALRAIKRSHLVFLNVGNNRLPGLFRARNQGFLEKFFACACQCCHWITIELLFWAESRV